MRLRIAVGVACLVLARADWGRSAHAQTTAPTTGESGTIAGIVLDKASGEPIIEAGVEVVDQKTSVKTDLDGKYSLELPPGQYQLRIGAAGYQSVRLQGIIVKANAVAKQNVSLGAAGQAGVQVVEVVAQANKAAEATQLLQRKKAAVVSDTVSAEVIAKSTSSDAAQVVQRVPAVTIKDGKFVFVRGLADRYSSSLLNGSRLPSTDPNRRVTPLDLFPASFLESLNIIKTYSPELPGDFTAGLIDIHLRDFPDQLTASGTLQSGGNSQTTFRRFNTNHSDTGDYFGFGADERARPDGAPGVPAAFPNAGVDPLGNQRVARSFKDTWARETMIAPPNNGANFSVGDTLGNFGYNVGGIYTAEYESIRHEQKQTFGGSMQSDNAQSSFLDNTRDTFKTRLGGLMTAAYKFGDNQKITFRSLVDRNTSDETRIGTGHIEVSNTMQQQTRFRYLDQELDWGQLSGEHKWSWLWVDWRSALSRSVQNEPDTRHLTYSVPPGGGPPTYITDSLSGLRLFNNLDEHLTDSATDFTIPFKTGLPWTDWWSGLAAKLKFGAAYSYRTRSTDQRFYNFDVPGAAFDLTVPPEVLFQPAHMGPGGITVRLNRNHVAVSQEIGAGYGMLDLPLVRDQLRLVGGVRVESSFIRQRFNDQQGNPTRVDKNDLDPLPGINLIWTPLEDMNVHLAWSKTVSRPDFRELTPLIYVEQRQDFAFQGNPDLVESHIDNYDLRWDWFFSPLELASASIFYKKLDQPIEPNVLLGASDLRRSFENADTGWIKGIEVEGRKDFGFITPALKNLSVQANVAYIDSQVKVQNKVLQAPVTEPTHKFPDQSPYIVNAVIDYTHPDWGTARLLYNTSGTKINAVGTFGFGNIEEKGRNQLDAVLLIPVKSLGYPFTLKLGAENLLDDPISFTEDNKIVNKYNKGIKVVLAITYNYN